MALRLPKARSYQDPNSPVRRIAGQARPMIRREIKEALKQLDEQIDASRMLTLLKNGLVWRMVEAIDWNHFREVMKAAFDRIVTLHQAGAGIGVDEINRAFSREDRKVRFGKAIGDRFSFDILDEATIRGLKAAQDALIAQMSETARETLLATVVSGVRSGRGPEDIVDDIRAVIGLTDRQAMAVLNYQRMVSDLDPIALQRQLRNPAFDAALQDAIDSGMFLPNRVVDEMVQDYADNYLSHRAAMIAQTESIRASNAGLHDAYRQAIERGALTGEAVRRYWKVALDEKTCPVCLSIPEINAQGVGVDEPFASTDGPQDDPPIHPNCRCSIEYVTDLDLVPE